MDMKSLCLLVLGIVAALSSVLAGNCGVNFKGKCSCGRSIYDNRPQYIVNCTNEGFKDTAVLEHLPEETEVLIFTGNTIPELPWNVFGTINELKALRIVDMSNNHIREIRGKSYHHVPNVQRLILNHNQLSISRDGEDQDGESVNHHHPRVFSNFINLMELHLTNTFADNTSDNELSEDLHDIFVNSNLTKLIKLHLEQNSISSFKDKRVFCDLPSLRDLHLGDNRLKEINFNVLCLKNLRFLDLERNLFENVKTKDLIIMDALQDVAGRTTNLIVDFTYNPFRCDCSLFSFLDWMNSTHVTLRNKEHYTCVRNNGKAKENVNEINVARCKIQAKNKQHSSGHKVTMIFLLVVLSFVLFGLIAALIYVSKDRWSKYMTPVVDQLTKKVHYTTIKDEEAPEVHV